MKLRRYQRNQNSTAHQRQAHRHIFSNWNCWFNLVDTSILILNHCWKSWTWIMYGMDWILSKWLNDKTISDWINLMMLHNSHYGIDSWISFEKIDSFCCCWLQLQCHFCWQSLTFMVIIVQSHHLHLLNLLFCWYSYVWTQRFQWIQSTFKVTISHDHKCNWSRVSKWANGCWLYNWNWPKCKTSLATRKKSV